MNVTIPESLLSFVEQQIRSGRYADADAFVAELLHTEARLFERLGRGEALPVDEHFDRRLEALLDEATIPIELKVPRRRIGVGASANANANQANLTWRFHFRR